MKKLTVNIIAFSCLAVTILATSCSVQHRPKQMRVYSNGSDHNSHADYDLDRERRYAPPRQY